MERKSSRKQADQTVVKRGHRKPSPLSFDQKRLWDLHHQNPELPTYNVYTTFRLRGPLDAEAMEYACNTVARRHEIWRTTYEEIDGQVMQKVARFLTLPLVSVDLRHFSEQEREEELNRLIREEIRQPIDLQQGPVVRFKLFQLQDEEHVMSFVIHHIAHDRVSFTILFEELTAYYRTYLTDEPPRVPDPAVQYADYAHWQQRYLASEAAEAQLAYWQQQLAGAPFVLQLPTDHPRPPVQTFEGKRIFFEVPEGLSMGIKELAQREGATTFMLLLAVYDALLYRYSGQKDLLVGTPFANRKQPEVARTLGYFLTSTVMRAQLSGQMRFRELLERVRHQVLGAMEYQGLPLQLLVDKLLPNPDPSRFPIFQAMFVYLNYPGEKNLILHNGLTMTDEGFDAETSRYDITVTFDESETAFRGFLEYNPLLHEATTAQGIVEDLLDLLAGIVEHPEWTLDQYSLSKRATRARDLTI